jgi:membrane-bound inhibitor of C-type lysozyme
MGGKMKVYLALIAILLSLTACSDLKTSTAYQCDDESVKLNIINNSEAELIFNNKVHVLNHEKSASGNKYINEEVLFWGKGNEAMLIIAGKKRQCTKA